MQVKFDENIVYVSRFGDDWEPLTGLLVRSAEAADFLLSVIAGQRADGSMDLDTFSKLDAEYSDLAENLSYLLHGTPKPRNYVKITVMGGCVVEVESNIQKLGIEINDLDVPEEDDERKNEDSGK